MGKADNVDIIESKMMKRGRKRGLAAFNPSRSFLEMAVEEFLCAGGVINRIELKPKTREQILSDTNGLNEVDEFLGFDCGISDTP
jgi:hypothetical protein